MKNDEIKVIEKDILPSLIEKAKAKITELNSKVDGLINVLNFASTCGDYENKR